jgi:hypothetical protein
MQIGATTALQITTTHHCSLHPTWCYFQQQLTKIQVDEQYRVMMAATVPKGVE